MIIECGYCGAPLDIAERKQVFACRYCGRKNERARARTLAESTPRDFAPPREWTPPPNFEADSSKPLRYNDRRIPGPIALGALALVVVATAIYGLLSDAGMFGTKPEVVARATLSGTPEQIAKALSGDAYDRSVRVTLHSDHYRGLSYSWGGQQHEHPSSFYLEPRAGQPLDVAMRARLASKLRGGMKDDGVWSWGDLSISCNAGSGAITVSVKPTDDNPLWRRQLDAAHKLVMGAVANVDLAPTATDMVELLATGYTFSDLTKVSTTTAVEDARQAVAKVFPGALFETYGAHGLHAKIAVAHPSLFSVQIQWPSARASTFEEVIFTPLGDDKAFAPKADHALATCLGKTYPPFKGAKDTLDVGGGVALTISAANGAVLSRYSQELSMGGWVKLVTAIDACR